VDVDGRELHPALAAIIARATRQAPSARYPSVLAMTEDLRRFIRDEPVSVYEEGLARRLVRAAARRPVLAMAIFSFLGFLASVAIVGAVVRDARRTERQAHELENTRRLLVEVTSRAHVVDVELSDLASDVNAIGAATIELLEHDGKGLDRKPRPLPPLTPFEPSGGAPVNFEDIVVTWPGKTPDQQLPMSAAKLVRLERWLRACLVDALPSADRAGSVAAQNAALVAGRSGLL
jgi:hypothetical protein